MKAAVFRGAGEIEVTDAPMPELAPEEVLIRVAYCGICGSDVEAFQTGMYEPGLVIGHEFSGTVAEAGAAVTGWQPGDRVIVNDAIPCLACPSCQAGRLDACESLTMIGVTHDGGMAEYVKTTARGLHRLPDGVSLRQAALIEPLAVALHGVRRSRLKAGDVALVCGAGPIGLLTLQCARLAGARAVAVSEVDACRAGRAAKLGAAFVVDPTRENLSLALAGLAETVLGFDNQDGLMDGLWLGQRPTLFTLTGPYNVWVDILRGRMGATKAITMRKLKTHGPFLQLLAGGNRIIRWVEILRTIPTEFLGDYAQYNLPGTPWPLQPAGEAASADDGAPRGTDQQFGG